MSKRACYRFYPSGEYKLKQIFFDKDHFPPPIHVHAGQSIFRNNDVAISIAPELIYIKKLHIFLTIHSQGIQKTWKFLSGQQVELHNSASDPILRRKDGSIIPEVLLPREARHLAQPSYRPWCILQLYVEDPDPAVYAWHVSYSVLLQNIAAEKAWYQSVGVSNNGCHFGRMAHSKSMHIISRNVMPHDAVGNFCLELSNFFNKCGYLTYIYAHDFSPELAGRVCSLFQIPQAAYGQTIFYNYSITDPFFPYIAEIHAGKKILYYHNVTPGHWFSSCFPQYGQHLDSAQSQYPLFSSFDTVIANSDFSLEQISPFLRKDAALSIFPPYFSLKPQTVKAACPAPTLKSRYSLLWVGRITPHKRPDLALKIFDELVKSGVDASLTFVGGGRYDFPSFAEHIDACLAALPAEAQSRVQFMQNISDEQLAGLYKHSDLLLCTSAHEGYCMPLAEAAACNLPVAATPQPAVLETLNGGGIILDENPPLAAQAIKDFLTRASEEERRAAIPVLKQLPTDELLRIVKGDT